MSQTCWSKKASQSKDWRQKGDVLSPAGHEQQSGLDFVRGQTCVGRCTYRALEPPQTDHPNGQVESILAFG